MLPLTRRRKIVAPGFVDVHNHSDAWLRKTPHLTSKTTQGFTTEVIMADGISYAPLSPTNAPEWITYLRALNALRFEEYTGWLSIEEYMAGLDRTNVQNSIPHVPYANVRALAAGWGAPPPTIIKCAKSLTRCKRAWTLAPSASRPAWIISPSGLPPPRNCRCLCALGRETGTLRNSYAV